MYKVWYNGLFGKIEMAKVNTKEDTQKMCVQNNMKLSNHDFNSGIGFMYYEEEKHERKDGKKN
jgi:hypothetical protein